MKLIILPVLSKTIMRVLPTFAQAIYRLCKSMEYYLRYLPDEPFTPYFLLNKNKASGGTEVVFIVFVTL